MGRGGGGERFRRKGTYVYLRLINVVVWQKPTQYCKAIILQLNNKFFQKKKIVLWKQGRQIQKAREGSPLRVLIHGVVDATGFLTRSTEGGISKNKVAS